MYSRKQTIDMASQIYQRHHGKKPPRNFSLSDFYDAILKIQETSEKKYSQGFGYLLQSIAYHLTPRPE